MTLLSDIEFLEDGPIPSMVIVLQKIQKTAAFTYHLQKAPAGVMVFFMCLEVLSQIINPFSQDRNLYFRRARIHLVGLKRGDNLSFPFFRQHDSSISLTLLGRRIIQC